MPVILNRVNEEEEKRREYAIFNSSAKKSESKGK